MSVTYYEHYPHYMGTLNAEVTFTNKEWKKLITLSKAAIKEDKALGGGSGDAADAFEDFKDEMEKKCGSTLYALDNAILNCYDSPRRPSTVANAIKKKGVWSAQWEEGSHAFATTAKKARKAVGKIEAKVAEDEFDW